MLQTESRTGVYRQKMGELEFTDRKQENLSLQTESRRELYFTDRKQENWSLQIKNGRTGVYRSRKTKVYGQKVGELDFVNLYFFNK